MGSRTVYPARMRAAHLGAGFAGAGGWSARRWCFGGGGWSARPPVVLWRRRLRRPRQASTRAASVAGSWRQRRRPVRVRAVARSTNSASATASRGRRSGRRWRPRPRSGFSGARRGRAAAGPSCSWRCGCAVASQKNRSGRATTRNIPNLDPPTSSRYTTKVLPHLRRYVRRPAVLPPSVFLAPSLLPAVRPPSTLPTPPATPVAGVVPGVVLPDAPRPCRCQPASCAVSHQRPCRCQAGSCSASSAQRPCRCQLASSAQRSCRSSQAMRDASRIALNQHFCACARVVTFCDVVYICFANFRLQRSHFLWKKLDDEWPESIFHHVGSQSASYLLSVL